MERHRGFWGRLFCQVMGGFVCMGLLASLTNAAVWADPGGVLLAAFVADAILGGQHR